MRKVLIILSACIFFTAGGFLVFDNASALFGKKQTVKSVQEFKAEENIPVPEEEETQPLYSEKPKIGEQIGVMEIPKLEQSLAIFHGANEDELEKGVGHYQGSVLPGEKDNSVLSGHRDSVFRELGEVEIGDELIVTTSAGEFTYKVGKIRIVEKDDRTIIVPKPRATLTVSTCYPFRYIGPAPQRFILTATLVETKPD
ncbi:class D sortase [Bacillus salacetis]|uniref:Class D sortase n=1 Tax=Bacillus salacetis TaxID=2315464 RepID=A0A3A1QUJ6_9BACI|nr:class D sortase [Bacillus salacetis]RIW31826.1 class D sortase [Bacillus salacetis]